MNELEDTNCEIRRTIDLQLSSLFHSSTSFDEESKPQSPSPSRPLPSNTIGGFIEDGAYAWLASDSRLTVFNTRTGANISTWTFRHRVTCVAHFPSLPGQVPLLLVGLDNDAPRLRDSSGMICIFDSTKSQVLRAIRMPAGVEELCIISGGADWEESSDKRVDSILIETNGMACIALRNFTHMMIDLKRNSWENFNFAIYDESNPAEIDAAEAGGNLRQRSSRERHAVHNLMSSRVEKYLGFNRDEYESSPLPPDNLTTVLTCSRKIGCLISGCLGRVIMWQNDGVVRWISPSVDDGFLVTHLALLEPTDDPRPFCYLWIAYQEETLTIPPLLRMYAMLFERKYSYKGTNQYFNLEGEPSLKLELELEEGARVTSLHAIIRDSNQEQTESSNKRGEESLLLISSEGRTFLFDLNQWYKEQMPRVITECANADAILASYQTKTEVQTPKNGTVSCIYVPSTLKEFASTGQGSPEEFFFPNSLSLEWAELGTSRITVWMTRGVQAHLLREMSIAGPVVMINPGETFHRCIALGLIPLTDASYNSEEDSQRDMLLTLCLEQRWTTFLLRCVKEWSDGSAAYLFPAFIRWAVQRASTIKLTAHRLCIPLFDQSGSSIGEAEIKMLRSFSQQMECLSNVVENLSVETMDLNQQRRTLKRITIYLQVLLWFYDVGLLPEVQEIDEESLPISIVLRIPYPIEKLSSMYAEKREKDCRDCVKKDCKEEDLFIDELIRRDCEPLVAQWEREGDANSTGLYPPPSLQSLLRSCLTDCYNPDTNEMENKHQIIIYLLMDLVMLLQGSCPSVDQLVKYTAAFNIGASLTKLTQAFWLLDHEDYHGFLEIMTGQLVCDSDVKDWHHKLVIRTLIKSSQNKLALIYLRVRKPPLSSIEDQETVITLSVEHGLVQSAFHRRPPSHYSQLLTRFFRACKANGRLNDILHLAMDAEEEEAFIQFLEAEKCEETRLLYYLQRSRYNEASGINLFPNQIGSRNNSSSVAVVNAYNATLPEVTRKFTANLGKRVPQIDADSRYPRPMSHYKSRTKIQQLHESVVKKAKETFTRGDRLHIPFITAPSISLRASMNSTDANCVMFLQRARKPYGKRTLAQMRETEESTDSGPRKRRRTDENERHVADADKKQLSLSMAFDTPLVKRKNQFLNSKNPSETPQSILKIRRMMQESITPRGSPKPSPDEEEREKRPRQIRFSINQPQFDSSVEESAQEADTVSIDESREESVDSESNYHSPSEAVSEQSAVLSDNSLITVPIAGPRRRPSLRKSLNDTSDLLKKSLKNSMINSGDSSLETSKLSLDDSVSSDIVSSTLCTPRTLKQNYESLCASAVLSSDTSCDISVEQNRAEAKNNGTGGMNHSETSIASSKNESTPLEDANDSASALKEEEFEENEAEMVDVNDNSEHESNFEKSYLSMETDEELVRFKDIPSKDDESTQDYNPDVEMKSSGGEGLGMDSQDEETETINPSDEYDEELMDLKYDDDDDEEEDNEVFKSLSNSVNVENTPEPRVEVQPEAEEASPKKTAVSRFYEDNMTDDESSRSVDGNLEQNAVLNSVRPESVNITDDESDREENVDLVAEESEMRESPVTSVQKAAEIPETRKSPVTPAQKSAELPETRKSAVTSVQETAELPETRKSPVTPVQEVVEILEEVSTPRRTRRASSLAPVQEHLDTPEVRRTPRTRRASSLVPEILSPAAASSTPAPESPNPATPSKRRGRKPSLMKEVLTSSILEDLPEVPTRRVTRRAASVQKDLEASKTPESLESSEPVKKPRGRRAASVTKEVNSPRKTRAAVKESSEEPQEKPKRTRGTSVTLETAEEHEEPQEKPKRTRGGSVAKEVAEEVEEVQQKPKRTRGASIAEEAAEEVEEPQEKPKRTRGISVTKEPAEEIQEPQEKQKRTRGGSVAKEVAEDVEEVQQKAKRTRGASVAEEAAEEVEEPQEKPKRTRGISVTKEAAEEIQEPQEKPKRTRATSVTKEPAEEVEALPRRTRTASVADSEEPVTVKGKRGRTASGSSDTSEEPVRRNTRATSVSKEPEPNLKNTRTKRTRTSSSTDASEVAEDAPARRTRAASVTKEIAEEVVPRRRRGGSVPKEAEPVTTRRRGAPASKDDGEEEEVGRLRRRGSVPKELPSEALRKRRGGSIVKEVILEEDDAEEADESERGAIPVIPEEIEDPDVQEGEGRRRGGRQRRAMSVDLPGEIKRVTRKKSVDEEIEKKSPIGKKVPARRKRAASETKDLGDSVVVERPRRGRKASQSQDGDAYQFAPPEEARDAPTNSLLVSDVSNFIFSPPATGSSRSTSLPRREIVHYIPPLTDEEKERIKDKSRMSKTNVVKNVNRLSRVPGYRTKFVISKSSRSNFK